MNYKYRQGWAAACSRHRRHSALFMNEELLSLRERLQGQHDEEIQKWGEGCHCQVSTSWTTEHISPPAQKDVYLSEKQF